MKEPKCAIERKKKTRCRIESQENNETKTTKKQIEEMCVITNDIEWNVERLREYTCKTTDKQHNKHQQPNKTSSLANKTASFRFVKTNEPVRIDDDDDLVVHYMIANGWYCKRMP